jgi:ferredoxin--NADP+ reductase
LQKIQVGDSILLGRKTTGTLVLDALAAGRRLTMLSTGTGIAPFASLIRDPETYEKFEQVILTHTCRNIAELAYGKQLVESVRNHEFLGELAAGKLVHYDTVTREDYPRMGRITTLIESGKLFTDLGNSPFDPAIDRVMICGSTQMTLDCKNLAMQAGLREGANNAPAEFVIERAFVG